MRLTLETLDFFLSIVLLGGGKKNTSYRPHSLLLTSQCFRVSKSEHFLGRFGIFQDVDVSVPGGPKTLNEVAALFFVRDDRFISWS